MRSGTSLSPRPLGPSGRRLGLFVWVAIGLVLGYAFDRVITGGLIALAIGIAIELWLSMRERR
jgi:hypothetical protein